MAHVFIVDENTLSVHLKYKFAGTGAKVQIAVLPEKRLLDEVIQKVNELYSGQFTDGDNLIGKSYEYYYGR